MRDLLFKNLTSLDKRRRIIASSEVVDKHGVHSVIRRHFVYILKEVNDEAGEKPAPYLYVFKKRDTKSHKESFFCRMKGSLFVISKHKIYLISYMHSLSIKLQAITTKISKE